MLDESVIDLGTGLCDEEVALAERVLTGAKAHGADVYQLRLACGADDERMPEVVHRYLRLLFSRGSATRWLISDPVVVAFTDLARRVSGECEHTKQFLRFSHLSDDSWAARFSPRDSTIPLVGDHFARRMRPERFFIVDPRHQIAAFHEKDRAHCVYARMDAELVEQLGSSEDVADDEAYVRAMWKRLYDGLELEGRGRAERGYDLRMHFMPKRFWDGLPELDPRSDDPGDFVPERYRG